MASERSLYKKIQEVLVIARSVRVKSLRELRDHIESEPPDMFKTRQYDAKTDTKPLLVSPPVVRRAVNMCLFLELLSIDGRLTETGREALHPRQFDQIVAECVRSKMLESGVHLSRLNDVIVKGLQASPPALPTSGALWEAAGNDMAKGLFTRLLTLLAHCGAAESSQRKIFLRIDTGRKR